MFELQEGDKVRIERSICINGHFYLRIEKKDSSDNFTLGFGYDEPFKENNGNFVLNNFLQSYSQMAMTFFNPVKGKWVKYLYDYPRNPPFVPNKYHIITNWILLNSLTIDLINSIIYDNSYTDIFETSFSSIAFSENKTDNCRTIILKILKESLSIENYKILMKQFEGNPLWNDIRNGCMEFDVKDKQIFLRNVHPCGNSTQNCCKNVIKTKHCERIYIANSTSVIKI